MLAYELKDTNSRDALWTEVVVSNSEMTAVRSRIRAGNFHSTIVTPDSLRDGELLIVRVPVSRHPNINAVSMAGPLVLNAVKGLTAIIPRPNFLSDISVGIEPREGDRATLLSIEARSAEAAFLDHRPKVRPVIRDVILLYLKALSEVQKRYGIRGNGEQSLRFISHFWNLGDVGVAARFERVASKLSKHAAPSSGPEPEAKSSKNSLDTRLATLEQRLAHRGPR